MLKTIFAVLLPLLVLVAVLPDYSTTETKPEPAQADTGTLEKMIVANGTVSMDIDLTKLTRSNSRIKGSGNSTLSFDVKDNSFFTVVVFNNEFRGPLPSAMELVPRSAAALPGRLNTSYGQLTVENSMLGDSFEFSVRDAKSGFNFFNIEGHEFEYAPDGRTLGIKGGRLLLSREFATELGRAADTREVVGTISIDATMRPIEVTQIVNGETESQTLPAMGDPNAGTVPGPDVIVGDVTGLAQFGSSSGTQVGLALGTDSCNFGTIDLNWIANPSNDHPVIPQNLYRMSGGANNEERFEQVGQSQVKHAFTALTQNLCQLGCNGTGGSRLGSGCSDPYSASLNSGPNLGSRAWINPFTGFFPRNDSGTPNNNHSGHTHVGPSHRILTEISDLSTAQNAGATYYAEAQYITPHEYAWCQSNPTQCNMYNNVSYRRYNVNGTGSPFSFSPVGGTVRQKSAINAWTGATISEFRPDPGVDGIGYIGYKVTETSPGVWHYEYAIYNQNLDRAVQSFSVPTGTGVTLSNVGFHAPPQHPGWTNDGTVGSTGFSNTPWAQDQTASSMTWSTETFAQNPNANAIRWGTMYNFRFDSNRPPRITNATMGFLKTGAPITVQVMAPEPSVVNAVSISGRIQDGNGNAITRALVKITGPNNFSRFSITGTFGNYHIDGIPIGSSYTVTVSSGKWTFDPRQVSVNGAITDFDFTATSKPLY
ncbi:MAG: carboxypeptidase regulatory-like domain-containing protein [Pyrinomonadaceae bacterium]|nr:carboxypeptidase regulatory-like domain-containing protein [Pyrinomonadaceae bacterium]